MKGSGRKKSYLIYSYEDKENNAVYVGLTVDLKNRHSKHKNGSIRGGVRKHDSVAKHFQKIGKELPYPIILKDGLDKEEDAQYYENRYLARYHELGWTILNIAKTGIGKSSIGGCNRKWTIETLKEEAKKYSSRWDFGKNNESAYKSALDLGIIDELFPEKVIKENGYWEIFDNHLKESEGCKSKKDYDRKNHSAYNMAVEYGFINRLFPNNLHKPITDDELKTAKNYKDRNELSHNNRRLYLALYKRNLLDIYYPKKAG